MSSFGDKVLRWIFPWNLVITLYGVLSFSSMMKYKLDKDLKMLYLIGTPMCRLLFPLSSFVLSFCSFKKNRAVKREKYRLTLDSGSSFNVTLLTPLGGEKLPLVLYLHGGAYVYKAAPHHYRLMEEYCIKCPCRILFVDYSLSPSSKYPGAVEETAVAYKWAIKNLGADRIALMGDSAGGEIAISTVMRIIDENLVKPTFLALIYPVVAPVNTPSLERFVDTPVWNAKLNRKMWKYYLGEIEYSSAFDYPRLSEFPPVYMERAEFDCLSDEGDMLSAAFRDNGVDVVNSLVKGAPHGYDIIKSAGAVKTMTEKRIMYFREHFEKNK